MIDLRRLQVLRVLQQQRSVTRTAHALHLTPSAVSQQIRLLGRDLGVDLLQRHGRGVQLTPVAESLVAHADAVYARWEEALAEIADVRAGQTTVTLRVCGFPTAVASLIAPAAALLRGTHPQVTVRITEAETPECYAWLVAEETDVAIVVPTADSPPVDDARLDQARLLDDPFDLIVPARHRLVGPGGAALTDAAGENWIAAPDSLDQHRLMLAAWAAAGFAPRITHQAQEWNAIVALVAQGFGVALIPRLAPLPSHQPVVRLPLRGEPTPFRRVLTVVRRGSRHRTGIAEVCTALAEVAAGLPPRLLDDGGEHAHAREATAHRPHRHTYR